MKTRAQLLLAAMLMAPGLAVYLLDRPNRVYFIPDWWQAGAHNAQLFGSLGGSLPNFSHVVFFTLITAVILAPRRLGILLICLSWFCIDSLFELAQHDAIAARLADLVPAWFDKVLVLENTRAYLLAGTFDPLDMASIAAGSLLAYVILRCIPALEPEHEI